MIEIVSGMASVSGAWNRVLRPGDAAELDPAYEARLVAAGIARSLGAAPAADAAASVPETPETVPEEPEIVPKTPEKDVETTENLGKQVEIKQETPENEPPEGGSAEGHAGDLHTPVADGEHGIPPLEELAAMKRPELAELAVQWGVECPVGTTNAAIVGALVALAAEQAPGFAALGAVE